MRYKFVPDPGGDPRRYRLQAVGPHPGPDVIEWEATQFARLEFLKWRVDTGRLKTVPVSERRSR